MQIELKGSIRNKHVPNIECLNSTIKVLIWLMYTELIRVYNRVLEVLLCKLVYAVTFWLNIFPENNGVSAALSPQAIITGQSVKFSKHCLLEFGEYVHNHEDGENSMESQKLEALALHPTGKFKAATNFSTSTLAV